MAKYAYLKIVQQHTEQGWEDVDAFNQNDTKGIKDSLKAYRQNQPEYAVRVVKRRIKLSE